VRAVAAATSRTTHFPSGRTATTPIVRGYALPKSWRLRQMAGTLFGYERKRVDELTTAMNHVFISYRHESAEYGAKVRAFAESVKAAGLPVAFDQFYLEETSGGGPDGGWSRWCIENAKKSACVLIVCSKGWFDAAQGDGPSEEGLGVAAEAKIFLTQIYRHKSQNARVRLVILDNFDQAQIPDEFFDWQIFRPIGNAANPEQMQDWIRKRLAMPSSTGGQAAKVVYVAECKYDLRTERANLCDCLVTAGWQLRPGPAASSQPIEDDFRESLAFVQLLESYPRDDNSHRTQLEQARLSMPCFRFRHSKIRLDEVEEAHRAFLTEPDVIPGGFDDFKINLVKELEAIWNKKLAPLPYASRDVLVRVAIRAKDPDSIWDNVFSWVDNQPGMRPALLEGGESFKEKQNPAVPCHGFLIVCDEAAQEGLISTKTDLEQCMQIQLGERNEARRPPVALVFCPPPTEPKWSRLVRVSPPKLHRIVTDTADKLKDFFEEVRKVAT
jgi:SEFIR domain